MVFCLCKGAAYIGALRHLKRRFRQRRDLLRLKRHECRELQNDFDELGAECFVLLPVEFVEDESQLSTRERA